MTLATTYARCLAFSFFVLALTACGGSSSNGDDAPPATISASVSTLALIAGETTPVALMITNNSNSDASDVAAILPTAWSDVVQDASACATLPAHHSCTIHFTAGLTNYAATAVTIDGRNSNPLLITMAVNAPTTARISATNSTLHLVAASGVSDSITVTNNSVLLTATNIAADLTGTALSGHIVQDASGCASVAPAASCTLVFTPQNVAVTAASFPIIGDNTTQASGQIDITLPTSATITVAGSPLLLQATNGVPVAGTLTITNTSPVLTAINISATLTATALAGAVTQDVSNCVSVAPLASCTLSFTPGNAAVANTSIIIQGSNTSLASAHIAVNAAAQATLSISGSPLVLFASGAVADLTVTNTSVSEPALNVAADLTGTALNGLVTVTASTCSGTLAPSASCTLSFTPSSTGVAQTSFPIAGSNTQTTSADIRVVAIGDSYQGGIVFLLPSGGNPGKTAATADTGTLIWGGFGVQTNAQSNTDGAANTATIVATLGAGSYAASSCTALTDGGFADWYLPAKDELNALYTNRVAIGGFASTIYWSSTEVSGAGAPNFSDIQDFNTGFAVLDQKNQVWSVRCIRAFN